MAQPHELILPSINFGGAPDTGSVALATATANSMLSKASSFMDTLRAVGSFSVPGLNVTLPSISKAPTLLGASPLALRDFVWSGPSAPASFSVLPPDVSKMLPGEFTGTAPTLNFGSFPSTNYGSAPAAPKVDLNFTMPTLSLALPDAPDLMQVSAVPFSGVDLPTFSATAPQLTAVAPDVLRYVEGPAYVSTLLDSLRNDLTAAIADGSYLTLAAQAQQALWDAGREREYRQQADALADLNRMEQMGYAFPPGVWLDMRIKLQTETANTIGGLSRDIMYKQAELQLENLTKSRDQAVALESKAIDYANQIAQRAFESCKYVTEAAVSIYNASVEAYKAALDGYRTQAQVFETLLKGAQIQVDIYRAELEAEKLKVEVNSAMVAQYKAMIEAQGLFVEIYKSELGAIETQANLQKIIVEAYGEEIKAYVARINAYGAQVDAYKARVESQVAVQNAYKSQVDAYAATVNAGAQRASATIEGYKAQISGYTANLESYRANIQSLAEQARAASQYNSAAADVYRSQVSAITSYNEVLTKQWQAQTEIAEDQAKLAETIAKNAADVYIQSRGIAVEAIKGGAQVSAQLGAAALGAIHFSTTTNWSSAISGSIAGSISNSYSGVDSYSQSASV